MVFTLSSAVCLSSLMICPNSFFWSFGTFLNSAKKSFSKPLLPRNLMRKVSNVSLLSVLNALASRIYSLILSIIVLKIRVQIYDFDATFCKCFLNICYPIFIGNSLKIFEIRLADQTVRLLKKSADADRIIFAVVFNFEHILRTQVAEMIIIT